MKPYALLLLFLLPAFAAAQALGAAGADPLTVTISPDYPRPHSTAAVSVTSSVFDITNATLTISVNGKQIYSGNPQPIGVSVGAPGTATTIKVSATSAGQSYSKTLTLRPADVSLIEEPLSTAPALYPGRSLPASGGTVRFVAVADLRSSSGARLDPTKLSYSWSLDGTMLENASGIGRRALVVAAPLQYREAIVSVVVQSQDGSVAGGAELLLTTETPTLRLYESDPLQGVIFDRAIAGPLTIAGGEVSLYAAPYSFSLVGGLPLLRWFLNNEPVQGGNVITLRPTGSGQGTALLGATASKEGTFESASSDVSITFGRGATNLFGL